MRNYRLKPYDPIEDYLPRHNRRRRDLRIVPYHRRHRGPRSDAEFWCCIAGLALADGIILFAVIRAILP